MQKPIINYETLIRITKAISMLRDPEEIVLITVEGVTHALNIKGCALFLFSAKSEELRLAGSYGLSDEYLAKGEASKVTVPFLVRSFRTTSLDWTLPELQVRLVTVVTASIYTIRERIRSVSLGSQEQEATSFRGTPKTEF